MRGLSLKTFRLDLHKIDPDSEKPVDTIRDWDAKLAPFRSEIDDWYGKVELPKDYHRLPLRMLKGFSFDELCKLHHSSTIMMDRSVTDLFETHAQHEIVRKIESSMWRWGMSRGRWNEIVDAYDHIRRFSFSDDPDFEIRLDFSTYVNPYGYAKFSRTFIDGVFAFLVYYKRKHVLTLGFSIMAGRKLLLQQVQSAQRSGNRWLYKLPQNRLAFAIDLFRRNFPGYSMYLVDGSSLTEKTIRDYEAALERERESIERWASVPSMAEGIPRWKENCRKLEEQIAHLKADQPRLAEFYRNVGDAYRLGKKVFAEHFSLRHYPIILASAKRSGLASLLRKSDQAA